jgi:hypothetical protein
MPYTVPQKAIEFSAQLADILKLRFSGKVVTQTFDTDGLPLITINDGTPATTEMNILIKVALLNWPLAKDILGNAANIYVPLVVQIATEAPAAGSGVGVYLTVQNVLDLSGEICFRGAGVQWYQSANGVVPVVGTLVAGNLKASFSPDLYNPITNQQ